MKQIDVSVNSDLLVEQDAISINVEPQIFTSDFHLQELIRANTIRHLSRARCQQLRQQQLLLEKEFKINQFVKKTTDTNRQKYRQSNNLCNGQSNQAGQNKVEKHIQYRNTQLPSHKYDWGHSTYEVGPKEGSLSPQRSKSKSLEAKQPKNNAASAKQLPTKKQVYQRIKKYRQQHAPKLPSEEQQKPQRPIKQQTLQLVKKNAEATMNEFKEEAKRQKDKKEEIAKKIKLIQEQSRKGLKKFKQKPPPSENEDFDLALSQHSTFSALRERKVTKKNKAKIQVSQEPLVQQQVPLQAKGDDYTVSGTNKPKVLISAPPPPPCPQRFFFWGIPIELPEYNMIFEKELDYNRKDNTQKTSFKEEAQRYLNQQRDVIERQAAVQSKEAYFESLVRRKKAELERLSGQALAQASNNSPWGYEA